MLLKLIGWVGFELGIAGITYMLHFLCILCRPQLQLALAPQRQRERCPLDRRPLRRRISWRVCWRASSRRDVSWHSAGDASASWRSYRWTGRAEWRVQSSWVPPLLLSSNWSQQLLFRPPLRSHRHTGHSHCLRPPPHCTHLPQHPPRALAPPLLLSLLAWPPCQRDDAVQRFSLQAIRLLLRPLGMLPVHSTERKWWRAGSCKQWEEEGKEMSVSIRF